MRDRLTLAPIGRAAQSARALLRAVGHLLQLTAAFGHDAWSYARGSGLLRVDRTAAQAQILKTAHRLDKGLALPQPRPGFGRETLVLMHRQLQAYAVRHGVDWAWREAQGTIARYRLHQAAQGAPQVLRPCTRVSWQAQARAGFDSLVRSRRSIRQFGGGPIPPEVIEQAVERAGHSPSVCNRSGARVWAVTDAQRRRRLLAHQNGHHGFADRASALLIVTVRPEVFDTVGERHQGWIDGGLYAMTLILSLHEQGWGTCCLNWSVRPAADAALKREAGLPRDELVVMLLAVGTLPDTFTVAHSPRRPLDEQLIWLDGQPAAPGASSR